MYLTGDFDNLENRMHQLIESGADVDAYQSEALSYGSGDPQGSLNFRNRWNRELHHKYREVNGSGYNGEFIAV